MSVPYGILIGGLTEYSDEYLAPLLQANGYLARAVKGPQALLDAICRQDDLLLLDVPGEEYQELFLAARAQCHGGMIVFGPRIDRLTVFALEHGADDYVARPFRADELMARIRAQLRRRQRFAPPPSAVGYFTFDHAARVIALDGRPLDLDLPEYALLSVLAESPRQRFSATQLLTMVWGRAQAENTPLLLAAWQRLRAQLSSAHQDCALVGDLADGFALLADDQTQSVTDHH